MERLRTIWDYLRTSFWFVPALMALGAVLLVLGGHALDRRLSAGAALPWFVPSWFLYVDTPEDARDLLSTLLSSMITMTSLVFSITMVVLSLAASQFGPRLIRSFMASPGTQIVLGTFVMTIVYCLLVLASIGTRGGTRPLAYASITIAIALTVLSVALLVMFLHSLARSIMSETVIERVGHELDALLDDFGPLRADSPAQPAPEAALPQDFDRRAAFFGPGAAGYVQAIVFDRLVAAAAAAEVVVGVYFRAGDFVVAGGRGIAVYPRERCSEDLARAIRRTVLIGIHRTPVQDPEFPIRHLVEIAVRALSPGVNDPYTAVAVIDRLSASLSRLMGRGLPSGLHRDARGVVRVVCPTPSYASLIGAAFDQIRQNGAGMPLIVIHLLEAIARIAEQARLPVQRDLLREQIRILMEAAGRRIEDPSDRRDIERRAAAARRALDICAGAPATGGSATSS
jgi:uncharacterized membrane protein